MNETSTAQTVSLRYRFGEIPLFSVRWPGQVYSSFSAQTPDEHELGNRLNALDPEVQCLFWVACPIDRAQPRWTIREHVLCYVRQQYDRFYVNLQSSFDDYLDHFSAKSRQTVRRKIRKLEEHSGSTVDRREYRTPSEIESFIPIAAELSRKTYQHQLLQLGFCDGVEMRRSLLRQAEQGTLRTYLLFVRNQPVAFMICPIQDDVVVYSQVGYDPAYSEWSPGTVLQYHVLERLFAEGKYRIFDFGNGQGPHKEFFATASIRCADIYLFRNSFRNRLLVRLHALCDGFSENVGKFLNRLGIKETVKKLLRRTSAKWLHQ